ncbi:MAG: hypothetical protein JNL02_07140 [Saprospiraceae bacterium]|nr:hypothetical protein [Saprospiraceae bacterium]
MKRPGSPRHRPIFTLLAALLVVLIIVAPARAQQNYMVSDALVIRNDYGYEIIGRVKDRILLFRDKYDEFEVQAYDNQMKLSWSRRLDDLDRRGIQILNVVGGRNDFSIIFKVRRHGITQLRVHKYDPGATLIDSMTLKNYGERVFFPPILDVVRSEDRNCFVVYNTAEREQLEMTCFRLDRMQVLWDKNVVLREPFYESDVDAMVLGNTGDLYLVSEHDNRKARIEEHDFRILRVNANTDQLLRAPLPGLLTCDVKFTYDNQNQRLVGAGLYGEKNRDRANGSFFLLAGPNLAAPMVRSEPFDNQFFDILRRRDTPDSDDSSPARGIADADVTQLVLREDGGAILIAERHHEIQRGATAARGFWRDGARLVVDYYYDDVIAVAFNPDGTIPWKTILHKKQYSQDDEGSFSSYFLMRSADQLHVLFNDEIKYENTCSEYVVSPLGDFDRNSLLNTFGQNLRLRFRDAHQISVDECLIPSEFRNRLKLVYLRF